MFKTLSKSILSLINLTILDLRNNQLEEIPLEIKGLVSKKRINSIKALGRNIREDRDSGLRDSCWICDDWV